MPHFLLNHGASGPLIDVWVAVSALREATLKAANLPIPTPQLVKALVDTGASHTAIDVGLVNLLGLIPTGTAQIISPTTGATPSTHLTYDVGIYVPLSSPTSSPWPFPLWIANAAELKHQGFSVLYGRDLLKHSTLYFDGANGIFTMTF